MGMKAVSQGIPAVHVVYFLHQWADPQDQFKGIARLLELRSFGRLLSMSTQGLDHWKSAVLQCFAVLVDSDRLGASFFVESFCLRPTINSSNSDHVMMPLSLGRRPVKDVLTRMDAGAPSDQGSTNPKPVDGSKFGA